MSDQGPGSDREVRVHVFGRTDVGQIREHNEDNFLVADLTRRTRSLKEEDRHQVVGPCGTLLGVCDGMGGAAAGEVASQLAVDIIFERLTAEERARTHDDLARRLVAAVEDAGARIFSEARADRTRRGMGTTATIAALLDTRLFVAQVGDSRCYVLREGHLYQVTRDQSLVNQLIEAGQLTEEEAETFEHNNIILQALGTAETVQVDLTFVDLCRDDTLLLCSDGLSGMIRTDEIREVVRAIEDPREACRELTDRANAAGGHDNITVIVARITGPGAPPVTPGTPPPAYRKYALPEHPSREQTVRAGPSLPSPSPAASPSPPGEPRLPQVDEAGEPAAAPAAVAGENDLAPLADSDPSPPALPGASDPVSIPTSGLPPAVVGLLVLGTLLLAAVAGFILLGVVR